jgi:hypothetical protein
VSSRPTRERFGVAATAVYIGTVAALSVSHALVGVPSIGSITLTPDLFAHGRLWLLVTSGFLVAGAIAPQILLLALLAYGVIHRQGVRRFWSAGLAGHVGSTVVTYAIVGALVLLHARFVGGLLGQSDYGVSCVWAGALGAVSAEAFVSSDTRGKIRTALLSAAVMGAISAMSSGLARPEHVFAFLFGASVVLLPRRRAARPESAGDVACREQGLSRA